LVSPFVNRKVEVFNSDCKNAQGGRRKLREIDKATTSLESHETSSAESEPEAQQVNHVILAVDRPLPVFPYERTSSEPVGMSQTCQKRVFEKAQRFTQRTQTSASWRPKK